MQLKKITHKLLILLRKKTIWRFENFYWKFLEKTKRPKISLEACLAYAYFFSNFSVNMLISIMQINERYWKRLSGYHIRRIPLEQSMILAEWMISYEITSLLVQFPFAEFVFSSIATNVKWTIICFWTTTTLCTVFTFMDLSGKKT